jgi:NAD(P)-dependent dehydrogenase (short-subunit alcohol dehydrogenase family)
MGWLDGKVGLLVGGGSGIGRGVADAFLAEGGSAAVLDLSEDKCAALAELGPRVHAIRGDATSLADAELAVEQTLSAFGRLDALAVFVGVFDFYQPLRDVPGEQLAAAFDETFRLNVLSCMATAKAALGALAENRGSITFTLSTSAFYPGRGGTLYVSSKFALRGLVTQLAHEAAPDVRVNGVAPGGTLATDMRGLRSLGQQERVLGEAPDREADLRSRTPLGVALSPADHAGAYVFLASDRARGITGVVVNSDGGIGVRG